MPRGLARKLEFKHFQCFQDGEADILVIHSFIIQVTYKVYNILWQLHFGSI